MTLVSHLRTSRSLFDGEFHYFRASASRPTATCRLFVGENGDSPRACFLKNDYRENELSSFAGENGECSVKTM